MDPNATPAALQEWMSMSEEDKKAYRKRQMEVAFQGELQRRRDLAYREVIASLSYRAKLRMSCVYPLTAYMGSPEDSISEIDDISVEKIT